MASQPSASTARRALSSSTIGASSASVNQFAPIGAFLLTGGKDAGPALEIVEAYSAEFPVLGGVAGYALRIAKTAKVRVCVFFCGEARLQSDLSSPPVTMQEYKTGQAEWKAFGEYVQQGVASVIAVFFNNPIPSSVEPHIVRLKSYVLYLLGKCSLCRHPI